jgi:hypothetical protein
MASASHKVGRIVTKIAELKKRLMRKTGFRIEYQKATAEYASVESQLLAGKTEAIRRPRR